MNAVLVTNADRMMMVATIVADGVQLSFADGCRGTIPYSDINEIDDAKDLSGLELPNPYEMILNTVNGEHIEIPWDFARHYCDESYRPTVEAIAMRGRRTLGERLRAVRDSAGLTQEELARAADIGRVTLVRLENGEQTPRVNTLTAIAEALGKRVSDLLVEPESLFAADARIGRNRPISG
ncbi:MAG: helix-turn-helix transcriptional regulator [Spirochaetaceae bacterium]|nr:helix-turn-helix transcriptional regulator [Spirochaetaceae bacterium]